MARDLPILCGECLHDMDRHKKKYSLIWCSDCRDYCPKK